MRRLVVVSVAVLGCLALFVGLESCAQTPLARADRTHWFILEV